MIVNITLPFNFSETFSSHLAETGIVYWRNVSPAHHSNHEHFGFISTSSFKGKNHIHYSIFFPDIRWENIRLTEGWAGLQHHSLLHTTIRLLPLQLLNAFTNSQPVHLVLAASQCSYIAILNPHQVAGPVTPRWYTCNIYGFSDAPRIRIPLDLTQFKQVVSELPSLHNKTKVSTIEFDVLISLDYEIRLFGDPLVINRTTPVVETELWAEIEVGSPANLIEAIGSDGQPNFYQPDQFTAFDKSLTQVSPCVRASNSTAHIFPHFVGGWAYGEAVGVEVTSYCHGFWTITHAYIASGPNGVS